MHTNELKCRQYTNQVSHKHKSYLAHFVGTVESIMASEGQMHKAMRKFFPKSRALLSSNHVTRILKWWKKERSEQNARSSRILTLNLHKIVDYDRNTQSNCTSLLSFEIFHNFTEKNLANVSDWAA